MFGIEVNETARLGIGIAIIFIGFLGLLMPLFVYRISINVAGLRETIDAMHGIIKNHIDPTPLLKHCNEYTQAHDLE